MRILAFSDVHNSESALRAIEKKAKKADLLACAGDFTYFEEGMARVLRRLNSFGKTVVLVHGNHEEPGNVKKLCSSLKNINFVHKKTLRINGYAFVGHGGEGFALESKAFERFASRLKFRKGERIVLVTHQPPHKTKLDFIWAHHGNKSYRKFIAKQKPVLAICGHLHETAVMEDKLGRTRLINPGDKGMIVEI